MKEGSVIWGKYGSHKWWPGMVVNGTTVAVEDAPPEKDVSWILWFGCKKISKVPNKKLRPFREFYYTFMESSKANDHKVAIKEALTVLQHYSHGDPSSNTLDNYSSLDLHNKDSEHIDSDDLSTDGKSLPCFVQDRLREIRELMENRNLSSEDDDDSVSEESIKEKSAYELVKMGVRKLEDICLACDDKEKKVITAHPLFEGGLCKECKENLKGFLFANKEDIGNFCCSICCDGGSLFDCHNDRCCWTYCDDCVATYLGDEAVKEIERTDPWLCFMCKPYSPETHGPLHPKLDWKLGIIQLFDEDSLVQVSQLYRFGLGHSDKPRIRVLSLFDGIGTGKLVLDKLGLDIDVFYSCEIDDGALLVTAVNHGGTIIQLGDIRDLTKDKLQSLGRIDLLIGGSPCNNFSVANPKRKHLSIELLKVFFCGRDSLYMDIESGAKCVVLDGDGVLFYSFFYILQQLKMSVTTHGHHVFWMFENVASMKPESRKEISISLNCEPAVWDARYYTPQDRPRLFWGNIPGMYTTPHVCNRMPVVSLQDSISKFSKQKTKLDALHCVTTNRNSINMDRKDGWRKYKGSKSAQKNSHEDEIWITEIERVFGFPDHYTDAGNLTVADRQKLIGRAWSIPVVTQILMPLANYYRRRVDSDCT